MLLFFILLPLLICSSALYLYRFSGRRELLNFDVVQFLYAFVLLPTMFVWFKSALFVILRDQVGLSLSMTQLFMIDTVFSTVGLFISFFIVIHSLTKSINLIVTKDPLVDVHELSEYFHLSFSHFAIYLGELVLVIMISLLTIFLPWYGGTWSIATIVILLGVAAGVYFYMSVINFEVASRNFLRIIKILLGLTLLIQMTGYYLKDVTFSPEYMGYWSMLAAVLVATFLNLFVYPTRTDEGKKIYNLSINKTVTRWVTDSRTYVLQRMRS